MKLYFEKRVLVGFFFALAIIVGLGVYSYFNNQQFAKTTNLVAHTNEVLFHSEKVLTLMTGIESGERGFVITGDSAFLEPFELALNTIDPHFKDLVTLTSDNSNQHKRLQVLEPLIHEKIEFAKGIIQARGTSFETARNRASSLRGKYLMDEIKKSIGEIQNEEHRLLAQRINESEAGFQKFTYAFIGLLVFTAIILITVFLTINFSLRARLNAEEKLRRVSDEIRDIYNNAPCGYHSLDPSGTIIEMNNTMLSWLGYERHEIVGKMKFPELLTSDSLATFDKSFPLFKEQGFISNIEYEIKRKDESTFQIILSSTAVYDEDGNYARSRSTVFDITDRKLAENKIKQLNHELEAFTYSVSHDLRAPLRSIDGYTRILQEDYASKLDEEGNRVMKVVMTNAKRMGRLIDDLLEFSRLGRKEVSRAECDMKSMATGVVNELMEHDGRNVDIKINDLLPCKADFPMIRQVWANLISNALKYTRKTANPCIEISSYMEKGNIIYSIRDNGVGFDMKYIGKLFGVFQRLHKVEDFEGTGVGLAIVYRIVSRHGGKVWAEAAVNEGASFYFSLPAKVQASVNGKSGSNGAANVSNVKTNSNVKV